MTVDKAREVAQALLAAADVAQSSTPAPYLSPDVIYQALGD